MDHPNRMDIQKLMEQAEEYLGKSSRSRLAGSNDDAFDEMYISIDCLLKVIKHLTYAQTLGKPNITVAPSKEATIGGWTPPD